ncbi:MAG: hypothetical protein H0W72_18070 [Planctomycetes bacterium]|nr:hypothetical protein [Planctomycetota bacterium]
MALQIPTSRLSPKNQATLPRDSRALSGLREGGVVCGRTGWAATDDGAKRYPIIQLFTMDELDKRERAMRERFAGDAGKLFKMVTLLNAGVRQMALDSQNRVVLPAPFVEHLGVDRDLFFVATTETVQVWNPDHFVAWSSSDQGSGDGDLSLLMI